MDLKGFSEQIFTKTVPGERDYWQQRKVTNDRNSRPRVFYEKALQEI